MSKKTESQNLIKESEDIFDEDGVAHILDMTAEFLSKVIIHALSEIVQDMNGQPPTFTRNNNFIFMEFGDKRFSLQITDNNDYN